MYENNNNKSNTSSNAASKKRAVALKYQQNQFGQKGAAPKVVAKGSGNVAQEILSLAKQYGVLVHQDDELSNMLAQLDLGQEIPEGLYHVIAELIAFSYVLQGKFPENWNNQFDKIDFME